jgi:hypothetical protein
MWTMQEVVIARRGTVLLDSFSFPASVLEYHIHHWRVFQDDPHVCSMMTDPPTTSVPQN